MQNLVVHVGNTPWDEEYRISNPICQFFDGPATEEADAADAARQLTTTILVRCDEAMSGKYVTVERVERYAKYQKYHLFLYI